MIACLSAIAKNAMLVICEKKDLNIQTCLTNKENEQTLGLMQMFINGVG